MKTPTREVLDQVGRTLNPAGINPWVPESPTELERYLYDKSLAARATLFAKLLRVVESQLMLFPCVVVMNVFERFGQGQASYCEMRRSLAYHFQEAQKKHPGDITWFWVYEFEFYSQRVLQEFIDTIARAYCHINGDPDNDVFIRFYRNRIMMAIRSDTIEQLPRTIINN